MESEGEDIVLAVRGGGDGSYLKSDAYQYNDNEDRLGDLLWTMYADGSIEEVSVHWVGSEPAGERTR